MKIKFILYLIFIQVAVFGQGSKKVLALTEIGFTNKKDRVLSTQINEIIGNEVTKSNKFTIVDRTKLDILKKERELQKTEEFLDSQVILQGKSIGAHYILSGLVNSVTNNSNYNTGTGGYSYSCQLLVSLKILDVETGEVVTAETIGKTKDQESTRQYSRLFGSFYMPVSSDCNGIGYGRSYDDALQNALNSMGCGIKHWINYSFPIVLKGIKMETSSREKAKTVLINGGTEIGLRLGQILNIYQNEYIDVDGKQIERKKQIGIAEVLNVEDSHFSIAKILEGPKTVYELMTNNTPVFFVSK